MALSYFKDDHKKTILINTSLDKTTDNIGFFFTNMKYHIHGPFVGILIFLFKFSYLFSHAQ